MAGDTENIAVRRTGTDLPDFENPPVTEVVLSVQFQPILGLGIPQIGLFWALIRDEFPNTEERPALDAVVEKYGPPQPAKIGFEVLPDFPPPRVWFKNSSDTELVQIQRDRFIFNWRGGEGKDPYPRYRKVRARFVALLGKWSDHLNDQGLPPIEPNQCEVTYVNQIYPNDAWEHHGQLDQVINAWSATNSDDLLQLPEHAQLQLRYLIADDGGPPQGHLYVNVEPRFRKSDAAPLCQMTLTARGAPFNDDLSGVLGFFDLGREVVVRAFASLTTKTMHKIWGRKDVD